MSLRLSHILGLTICLCFSCCEEDNFLRAGGGDCEDFSLSNDFGTNAQLEADVQYAHPSFNPKNSNEFVYVYVDRQQGVSQLRKHNIGSGQWMVLTEMPLGTTNEILGPPSWGSNGWILYHSLGLDTWKVKDDGTELTRLTFTSRSQWPIWNSTATLYNSGSVYDIYTLIQDDMGQIVDTLLIDDNGQISGALRSDWSFDNRICTINGSCDDGNARVIHFEYGSQEILHSYSSTNVVCGNGGVKDIAWGSGGHPTEIYFTTDEGLYRVDVTTDKTCKIMHFCTSIAYETFSVAPQGAFILATRLSTRVIDEEAWTIEFDRDIYKIDLATLAETKVALP